MNLGVTHTFSFRNSINKYKCLLKLLDRFSWASSVFYICLKARSKTQQTRKFQTRSYRNSQQWQHTFIVTLPFVTFLMLKPTVGIISSLNWPDWKKRKKEKVTFSAYLTQLAYTGKYHKLFLTICPPTEGFTAEKSRMLNPCVLELVWSQTTHFLQSFFKPWDSQRSKVLCTA